MLTAWTQHLKTEEEKERFEHSVRSSSHVLDHLKLLVEKDIKGTELAERSTKAYDNANWAYRQAHVNGYISAMQKIAALCNVKETDDRSVERIQTPTRRARKQVQGPGIARDSEGKQ